MVAYGFKGQGVKRIPLLLSSCFYRKLGGNLFVPSPRIHAGSFSRSGNNAPKMTCFDVHWIALAGFVGLFLFVTVLGFAAARWKQGDLNLLDEWGLGGRRFGIAITWFLVGGDLYTAYTIIAVPALVYSVGAYGFFAIPYAIITYPFVFAVIPRLWNVCQRARHLTAADFVHERYRHGGLAFAVAVTGLIATMPYI